MKRKVVTIIIVLVVVLTQIEYLLNLLGLIRTVLF